MDKVEVTIPFYFPLSFKRKRERSPKTVLVRDVVSVSIPHFVDSEAPVAFAYEIPPIHCRVIGDSLSIPAGGLKPINLDNLDVRIAQCEEWERNHFPKNVAFVLAALFGDQFANDYIKQTYGSKLPRLNQAPLDAVSIDSNQRDEKASFIAEAARDRLTFVGGVLYQRTSVPALTVMITGPVATLNLEMAPDWHNQSPDRMMFGLQNIDKCTAFLTRSTYDIRLDRGTHNHYAAWKAAILPSAVTAPDEACNNAAYAVSIVLDAAGRALRNMDAAAGDALSKLIRLRARAIEGDREAPGMITTALSDFRAANCHLQSNQSDQRDLIVSQARAGECAIRHSHSAPAVDLDDDPALSTL